ncbi:MAG: DNA translocase FtsK 4TM domain-containing protein, partial [Bacteroidota bacterium]
MAKRRKKSKPTTPKKSFSFRLSKQNKIILGSLLIFLSMALFFSFISYYFTWQEDQSLLTEFTDRNEQAKNLLNKFGAGVSHFFMYKGFGIAALIFPVLLCITGLYLFLSLERKGLLGIWIWGLVFVIWTAIALGFFAVKSPLLGGLIGYEMNDFLQDYTGKIGVFLLLLFGFTIILVRLFKFTPDGLVRYFKRKRESLSSEFKDSSVQTDEILLSTADESPIIVDTYTHKEDIPILEKDMDAELEVNVSNTPVEEKEDIAMEVEKITEEKEVTDNVADKLVADFGEFDPTLELGNFKFPTLELLDAHGATGGITINQEELEENKNKIVNTLKNYK